MDIGSQLVDFAEQGNQHRIQLKDGKVLQGWIMEIREDDLLISIGFSEKQGKDDWILFDTIDLEQLEYWGTKEQAWLKFVPMGT
jgi:hypothetical protein